jgi:acyl carrier protein
MTTELADTLRQRLAAALGVGPELITDDLELDELGVPSSELLELLFRIEDELHVVFSEDDAQALRTVADLIALIETATPEPIA